MKPLRVALVASSYAPHLGGVEQHTAHVAAHLQRRGHRVEVWTVARDGVPVVREMDGITVRELPAPLPARTVRAVVRFARSFPGGGSRWVRAWRSFRPDVLHVQCFGPNGLYAHALSSLTRTPLVLSSHGETDADDHDVFRRSFLIPAALRRALKGARTVTACSPSVAADLRENFGAEEVVVVPNGVAAVAQGESRPRRGRVVGVGRLEHNKGFDLLIRAIARVEDSHLVLVGDGSQRQRLESLGEELGIRDRVHFLGARAPDETRRTIGEAEVVVVPSRKESFGMVALEAWSAGTPLVATSTCGPAAFVSDGIDGLLVDPRDTAALARSIRRVLDDARLRTRLVTAGSLRVRSYTWESVTSRYEAIYRGVGTGPEED